MIRSALRPLSSASTWWALVQLVTGFLVGHVTTIVVGTAAVVVLSTAIVLPLAALGLWLLFLAGHAMAQIEQMPHHLIPGREIIAKHTG